MIPYTGQLTIDSYPLHCSIHSLHSSRAVLRTFSKKLPFNVLSQIFNLWHWRRNLFGYCTFSESLRTAASQGVDCYFDNVGGDMSTAVLQQMNHRQVIRDLFKTQAKIERFKFFKL